MMYRVYQATYASASLRSVCIESDLAKVWSGTAGDVLFSRRNFDMKARPFSTRLHSFVDRIVVSVEAGDGGSGCASFSRGPNQEIAPPDGGHGGRGGSIWLQASTRCTSLRMSTHNLKAENGRPGMSAKRQGRQGNDLVVEVPRGTIVRELHSPDEEFVDLQAMDKMELAYQDMLEFENQEPNSILVCELNQDGQRAEVVKGGCGGRGNVAFKSSRNRSPTESDVGGKGEKKRLELELKTIADVGLVGFPNAGKSTFLRAISSAKPKVASYPFTTLRPHIGVVNADSVNPQNQRTFTVADIPGLIEGAHENRGLGHEFLRHIERTAFLVYILDLSVDEGVVVRTFDILQKELEMHEPGLSERMGCIVANKMDAGDIAAANLTYLLEHVGNRMAIFPASARFQTGIEDIVQHISASLP